jgi:hypothetical protein
MKKTLFIILFFLFFKGIVAQVLRKLPEKDKSEMDNVFLSLEISGKSAITINQVEDILDSLSSAEKMRSYKEAKTYKFNEKGDTIYSIGNIAHGGIIFLVDKSGLHGLVALEEDQSSEVTFFDGKTSSLKGDSIYAGKYNTNQIIANKSVGYSAAKICSDFKGGGFNDWYLPSKFELNLLYLQYKKGVVRNFARDFYWSSSEDVNDVAWLFRFYDGLLYNYPKYGSTAFIVRAIGAF